MNSKKLLFTTLSLLSIIGYGVFVFAAPPGTGGYNPGETLDPQCTPGDLLPNPCIVKLPSSGSGWSLTGNAGTTAGTNFIGTTDPVDFMVKTNGNQVALFGQNGNIAFGNYTDGLLVGPDTNGNTKTTASGVGSMAWGGTTGSYDYPLASGTLSTAWGVSTKATSWYATAWGDRTSATQENATAFGTNTSASGSDATAWGEGSQATGSTSTAFGLENIASGAASTAFGFANSARSRNETAFGMYNVDYTPLDASYSNMFDRIFSIGNGEGSYMGTSWPDFNNAYTLWKDGSFAYNDDNFQNDTPGTEQNMFYFNYGNHDGNGNVNTKRAIRLGSAMNDEWDINSGNVGDRSIALGFSATPLDPSLTGPIASGLLSFATQLGTASGDASAAFGNAISSGLFSMSWGGTSGGNPSSIPTASGDYSTAWGDGLNIASGFASTAFGDETTASGFASTAFGSRMFARSVDETAFGSFGTDYAPIEVDDFDGADRLVNIGNGPAFGLESDAFTILKNGQTGIAIDNFEANTNGNIFQVGDGATGIIGYVDNGTGNWVAVSDERKKDNITDLTYGLNELIQLRPTSFNYKRNNEHTIGFLAQQVLPIIPEAVYGTESEGYGMSYTTLTPVIVKAIQELNLKITDIGNMETPNTWRDSLIAWFESTSNGIRSLVVKDKICVDSECLTKDDIHALLQLRNQMVPPMINIYPPGPSNPPVTNPDPGTPPVDNNSGDTPSEPVVPLSEPTPSDTGSNPLSDPTA